MAHEQLIQNYIDGFIDQPISCNKKILSHKFILFFIDFIHEKLNNFIDSAKAKSNLTLKLDENDDSNQENEKTSKDLMDQVLLTKKFENCIKVNDFKKKSSKRIELSSFIQNIDKNEKPKNKVQSRSQGKYGNKCSNGKVASTISDRPLMKKKQYDISSSNDFPTLSPISNKLSEQSHPKNLRTKKSRRIKPTLISSSGDENSVFNNLTSLPGAQSKQLSVNVDIAQEHKLLLNARLKCTINVPESFTEKQSDKVVSPSDNLTVTSNIDISLPSEKEVTLLNRLAEIHSFYIEKLMISSLIEEIHSLIMVLLMDIDSSTNSHNDSSKPVHSFTTLLDPDKNVKYFASQSLINLSLKGFFQLFNVDTLNLFYAHLNKQATMTALADVVKTEIDNRSSRQSNPSISNSETSHTFVPFKPDTDDRSNFLSDKAFHSFRKQRDMFYTLLRHWDNNKSENVSKEVVGQIKWLVFQVKQQSTYDAFLRLFLDHLLSICTPPADVNFENTPLASPLVSLLNGDSAKLRRLESRVTKASPSQKSNSSDWLYQEFQFFRDFVSISDSYSLNLRLCDVIQSRIIEIEKENCQFEKSVNEETVERFESVVQAINDLRILGNFYGLLVFAPYQDGAKRIKLSHMEESSGKFIISRLKSSLDDGHLLLTLPWVVQFLYFSSTVINTALLYTEILSLLYDIYRLKVISTVNFPNILSLFLGTILSSLFEQEFFNESGFYENLDSLNNIDYQLPSGSVDSESKRILTSNLISEMHWRLADVRSALKYKSTSLTNRQMPKKIKPLTEKLPQKSNIQAKLEAAFFRNQPLSLKRTVMFVSDRSHSNCVKHLCSEVLPLFCRKNEMLTSFTEDQSLTKDKNEIHKLANQLYPDAIDYLRKASELFVEVNINKAMDVLVSSSVSKPVLKTASEIAERIALTSVETWLKDRLLDHVISNIKVSLMSEQRRKEMTWNGVIENCPLNTSRVLHNLREFVLKYLPNSENLEEKLIIEQLTIVGQLLIAWEKSSSSLPHHVMIPLSFLVREVLCIKIPSGVPDFKSTINELDLSSSFKKQLFKLIEEFG